jgi:hypothetical protein
MNLTIKECPIGEMPSRVCGARTRMVLRLIALSLAAALIASSVLVFAQDWKTQLQSDMAAHFKLTKSTADKSDIVTAGSVVTLQQDNLVLFSISNRFPPVNTYKDGKISQGLLGALNRRNTDPSLARTFVAGEKFWVTRITLKDDGLYFEILSDPFGDYRYAGSLKFPFGKKGETVTVAQMEQAVAQVLKTDDAGGEIAPVETVAAGSIAGKYVRKDKPTEFVEYKPDGQFFLFENGINFTGTYKVDGNTITITPTSPRIKGGSVTAQLVGGAIKDSAGHLWEKQQPPAAPAPAEAAPAEPPMAPIPAPEAPPPPPKEIKLGQTVAQVIAMFGQPARIANLGAKQIYSYPDLKVTFVNGKVTDIQ